jgi:hypothetical protein
MKQSLLIIIGLSAGLLLGFLVGRSVGYSQRSSERSLKSYAELVAELRRKELLTINDFVEVTSNLKTIDEGGIFKIKNVSYLIGKIDNNALATAIKDIQLKVDYMSSTDAVISSQEITVYDIVFPNRSKDFKEKINIPEKTESFKFSVINLRTE